LGRRAKGLFLGDLLSSGIDPILPGLKRVYFLKREKSRVSKRLMMMQVMRGK